MTTTHWPLLAVVSTTVYIADQATKRLIVSTLELYETYPILPPVFQFTRSFNTGSAFGIFSGAGNLFLVIAILVTAFLIYTYPRAENALSRWATALVIGGAMGNATDRVLYGHVVDFIHYRIPGVISNVSNIADHAIVLGVGLMLWASWQADRAEKREREAAPPEQTTEPGA